MATRSLKRIPRRCHKHGVVDFVLEGRGYYRCTRCRMERVARRRRQIKEILVAECGGRCALFGYDRYHGALHFHHTDPSQKDFARSEEHTSELQSRQYLVCRLLLEKKKKYNTNLVDLHS